jgi:hypothetical protein
MSTIRIIAVSDTYRTTIVRTNRINIKHARATPNVANHPIIVGEISGREKVSGSAGIAPVLLLVPPVLPPVEPPPLIGLVRATKAPKTHNMRYVQVMSSARLKTFS